MDPVFSGTGAGTVSSRGLVYPKEAFQNAGFVVNEEVSAFFSDLKAYADSDAGRVYQAGNAYVARLVGRQH